jgi:ApeA N-terminal domain 1
VIETHEYKGLWWLPGDDSSKLAGTLTITRGNASLEVIGSFGHAVISDDGTQKVFSPAPASQPRILGHTANGKAVTLERCSVPDFRLSMPGIPTVKYRPRVVLVGAWFAEGEDIGFDEIATPQATPL